MILKSKISLGLAIVVSVLTLYVIAKLSFVPTTTTVAIILLGSFLSLFGLSIVLKKTLSFGKTILILGSLLIVIASISSILIH